MSPGTKLFAIRLVFLPLCSESFENCLGKRYERSQRSCCTKSIQSKSLFRIASCITRHTIFLNSMPSTYRPTYSHDTVEFQLLIGLVTGGNFSFIACANVVRGERGSFFVRTTKYPQLPIIGYHTNALLPRKKKKNSVN